MITDLGQLIIGQSIYLILLFFITRVAVRQKRKDFLYWFVLSIDIIYILIISWLIYTYLTFGPNPDSGEVFAWGMFSIIVPGLLVILTCLVFGIVQAMRKKT